MKKLLLLLVFCCSAVASAQNTCATAQVVTVGLTVVDAVNGSEIPTPICVPNGSPATAGEWFKYTPLMNYTVTVTCDLPVNIGDDPRLHIYKGECGALICVTGDDDSGVLGNPDALPVATFAALAGQTYYIAFDNKWDSSGFTFKIIQEPYVPTPVNVVSFTAMNVPTSGAYQDCVVDMNGDHLDDIVSVSNGSIQILQQNPGGGFTSKTLSAPATNYMPGWSIAAGDIDNNGYTDLVYGNGQGVSFMKQNNTGTAFTLMSSSEYVFSQRSNFVDLNNDGHLDAFVCHDTDPNVYYINDGNGNYTFHQGGMGDLPSGGNYGSIFVDMDNDGDADLFIAKCGAGPIDELHRNNGNGTFTDISIAAGMAEPSQSWSSAWADYDNDGYMDAMIGSSSGSNHKLRRNNGNLTFTDVTVGSGLDVFTPNNIENIAHDFDNDGFVDIFMGGNTIMINNGNMTFSPNAVGTQPGAIGDLNNDGFLDVRHGNTIYLNNGNSNNWITVSLNGIESNKKGIGTRLELYGSWGRQIRDIRSGDGFAYMSTLNGHFGIGQATEITKLVVKWPSGVIDEIYNPNINERIIITEGSFPLSVNNPDLTSALVLYPNPAADIIRIEGDKATDISTVKIYDMSGRLALTPRITNNEINVSQLSTGSYIVFFKHSNGKTSSSRISKK